MNKLILVALLVAVLFVLGSSVEGRHGKVCSTKRRCIKTGSKCVQEKRMSHCKKWIKQSNKVARCVHHETKTYCVKKQSICLAHKTVKRCHFTVRKPKVTGPVECPKGYSLTFKKTGSTIKRSCSKASATPRKLKTCNIFNDPHVTLFSGRAHEFQKEGDYNFAETADGVFAVHLRFKRYNNWGWTGIDAAAVMVNGVDVIKMYAAKNQIELNGKAFVANGADTKFKNGGSISTSANRAEVFAPNGARVLVHFYPSTTMPLINVYVFVPTDVTTQGVCDLTAGSEKPISGLFAHRMHVKAVSTAFKPKSFTSERDRQNAITRCKAQGLKGKLLDDCVFDMAQVTIPALRKLVLKMEHDVKKDDKFGKHAKAAKRNARRQKRNARKQKRRARKCAKRAAKRHARHIRKIRASFKVKLATAKRAVQQAKNNLANTESSYKRAIAVDESRVSASLKSVRQQENVVAHSKKVLEGHVRHMTSLKKELAYRRTVAKKNISAARADLKNSIANLRNTVKAARNAATRAHRQTISVIKSCSRRNRRTKRRSVRRF